MAETILSFSPALTFRWHDSRITLLLKQTIRELPNSYTSFFFSRMRYGSKFPRQKAPNNSKQLSVDGTMSSLIEFGRDLCISGRRTVCRFPICAFNRRLCAAGNVQIISDGAARRGKTVREICSFLAADGGPAVSKDMKACRSILNGDLTNFY